MCEHGTDLCHLQTVSDLGHLIHFQYYLYKMKSNGPNIYRCGTPHVIFIHSEFVVLYETLYSIVKITFEPVTCNTSYSYTIALEFIY